MRLVLVKDSRINRRVERRENVILVVSCGVLVMDALPTKLSINYAIMRSFKFGGPRFFNRSGDS